MYWTHTYIHRLQFIHCTGSNCVSNSFKNLHFVWYTRCQIVMMEIILVSLIEYCDPHDLWTHISRPLLMTIWIAVSTDYWTVQPLRINFTTVQFERKIYFTISWKLIPFVILSAIVTIICFGRNWDRKIAR